MEPCANTEALRAYEEKNERLEKEYELVIDELLAELEIDYNNLISRFDNIVKKYDICLSFEEFVKEEL